MKLYFLTIAFLSISIPSFAQQAAQSTGDFNYWATYSYDKEGDKICYMFTTPTKSSVKIPGRGDTFLVVTNNLAEATFGVVNIQSGFKYKKDVPVTVKIGKEIFTFTSFGDMAWVKDGDDIRICTQQLCSADTCEHAAEFRADALTGNFIQKRGICMDGSGGFCLNVEIKH